MRVTLLGDKRHHYALCSPSTRSVLHKLLTFFIKIYKQMWVLQLYKLDLLFLRKSRNFNHQIHAAELLYYLVRNELSHHLVPDKKSIKLRGVKGMVPGNQVHASTAPCQTPHLVVLQPTVNGTDTRTSCCVECYGCLKGIITINEV